MAAPAAPKEEPSFCETCCADDVKNDFVLMHESSLLYYWDIIIILDIALSLVIIPLRIGFGMTEFIEWLGADIIMDLFFILDIIITFFKSYEEDGETITKRSSIMWRYLKGSFALDLLASFPLEYVGLVAGVSLRFRPMFRVNRMFRFVRMFEFLLSWERNSVIRPGLIGIFKSIMVIVYMSHFVGCLFHLVVMLEGDDAGVPWTSTFGGLLARPMHVRYMRAFYWSIVSLTGYTQGVPTTAVEAWVSIFVTISSVAVFGAIIGVFGNLLTNLDSSKNYFRQKIDGVQEFMNYKKIPKDLQHEVREYYDYLWASGKALEKNEVVDRLPGSLKQRMNYHLNNQFISKVPFFKDVADDVEFIGEIVKFLRPRVGLPNSFVVRIGEYGTEMYFIQHGELNVLNDKDKVVFTLKDGMFFGEIALMYQTRRTASIVARTYCDMYVLVKEDFGKVLKRFPVQSKGIKQIAKERFEALANKDKENQKKEKEEKERRQSQQATPKVTPKASNNVGEEDEEDEDSKPDSAAPSGSTSLFEKDPNAATVGPLSFQSNSSTGGSNNNQQPAVVIEDDDNEEAGAPPVRQETSRAACSPTSPSLPSPSHSGSGGHSSPGQSGGGALLSDDSTSPPPRPQTSQLGYRAPNEPKDPHRPDEEDQQ